MSLIKELNAFKKRALAVPTIENKKHKASDHRDDRSSKKSSKSSNSSSRPGGASAANYKTMSGASQYKFSVLSKIVRHLRSRHQEGELHSLALSEILDETNQTHVSSTVKQWLINDALSNNPKVDVVEEGKFLFKPPLPVRDRRSLLKLLKNNDIKGLGGILLDDVIESLPHSEKILKQIDNDILRIIRTTSDKKVILFYNDKHLDLNMDEEFRKLWRNTSVEGMDDEKIDEYLNKQGITSMQDSGAKSNVPIRRRSNKRKTKATRISDNQHVGNILQNYDEN